MALLAILLAFVLGALVGLIPTSKTGEAFGQEKSDAELVSSDGTVTVRVGERGTVTDEGTRPVVTWKFVTKYPPLEADLPGKKMKLVLTGERGQAETFEVAHGGALGFYPYGKLQKAGHFFDFFRLPEVAVDQIEFDVYDFDELTESAYATLVEQMKPDETDAFTLWAKNQQEPNPFMILVAEQPTVSTWAGFSVPYNDTPFVGTAVVWNQDFAKLLDYYSVGWGEVSTVSGFTEKERMQYAKNAMYAVVASANGVADEQLAQFSALPETRGGKIYIGLPSSLKALGPEHVEAFSFKSHLRSGLYGVKE